LAKSKSSSPVWLHTAQVLNLTPKHGQTAGNAPKKKKKTREVGRVPSTAPKFQATVTAIKSFEMV
jgi:hypothetical protein